ncbi:hypothetical protein V6N12_012758 [Hibiscus sabdariffa]|uniref:Secreted protein n=1 Tax=Hibiscus sabdariffa TaxID=183260 RepID=A0ABR2EJ20_9ROSI
MVSSFGCGVFIWLASVNLSSSDRFPIIGSNWDFSFGSVIWFLWLDRNAKLFPPGAAELGTMLQRSSRLVLLVTQALGDQASEFPF